LGALFGKQCFEGLRPFSKRLFPATVAPKPESKKEERKMIAKVKMNSSISATISYCCRSDKDATVIACNGTTSQVDRELLIKQFQAQADQRPELKNKIMQIIISHSPEDTAKLAGKKEDEILQDYIQRLAKGKGKNAGLDLTQTQFVAIRHAEKGHIHYHLLANMVDNQGERLKDNNIGYKAKGASIDITKQHGLTRAISKELKQELEMEIKAPEQTQRKGFSMGR